MGASKTNFQQQNPDSFILVKQYTHASMTLEKQPLLLANYSAEYKYGPFRMISNNESR